MRPLIVLPAAKSDLIALANYFGAQGLWRMQRPRLSSARLTKRRRRKWARNIVERISV